MFWYVLKEDGMLEFVWTRKVGFKMMMHVILYPANAGC